jgi:hypothetical protein
MKAIISCLFIFFYSLNVFATEKDSTKKEQKFELSFGQSLLFISSSQLANIRNRVDIVVPTNAILIFTEFRPLKKIRIPVFINIATETKQFLINGVLTNEKASPTFGTGLTYSLFSFSIGDESRINFEIGPMASFIFDRFNQIRVAPIIASRFRIMRGDYFSMYFGFSYSFGIDAFGILYGTGSLF